MIRTVLTVTVCGLACCLGLLADAAEATFPGSNGRIALVSAGIQTVNPDGTGLTTLTPCCLDTDPAWSPDGTKVAFSRDVGDSSEIYVINADGTGLTQLTSNAARDVDPAWSPDGTKIVFASDRNELDPSGCAPHSSCNYEIYAMNADGTAQTRLTNAGFVDREPNWSTSGIAFHSDRDDANVPSCNPCNYEIYVMNADGTAQTRLTTNGSLDTEPNWSPDGATIAFASDRNCNPADFRCPADIFVMNLDGTAQTPLTSPDGVSDRDPAWSPDGTKMAINRISCGPTPSSGCVPFISVINADGSVIVPTLCCVPASQPDWQPLAGNRPPACSGVTASSSNLWPPTGKLVPVSLTGATDPDGDPVTISIDAVTQDEPVGNDSDAQAGSTPDQVALRAQRDGSGDGRVYKLAFAVSDGKGGTCSGSVTVSVPHDRSTAAVDSAPPAYESFGP